MRYDSCHSEDQGAHPCPSSPSPASLARPCTAAHSQCFSRVPRLSFRPDTLVPLACSLRPPLITRPAPSLAPSDALYTSARDRSVGRSRYHPSSAPAKEPSLTPEETNEFEPGRPHAQNAKTTSEAAPHFKLSSGGGEGEGEDRTIHHYHPCHDEYDYGSSARRVKHPEAAARPRAGTGRLAQKCDESASPRRLQA